MLLRALAAIAALLLASCGSVRLPVPDIKPYRIEIQQGNYVSQEMVAQLNLGMSKDQVRFVLGTPLITDSFHADRWDYVFRRQRVNSRELEQRKMAVFFDAGKLARIESDAMPAARTTAAVVKTPQAKAPAAKRETPAASAAAAVAKTPEASAAKPEKPAVAAAAPVVKTPERSPQTLALTRETPAVAPVAQRQPASGLVPEEPVAAPEPSGDEQPKEEKGWWERIKEKFKF